MITPRYRVGDTLKCPAVVGFQRLTVLAAGPLGLAVRSESGRVFTIPRNQCDPRTVRVVARPARLTIPSFNS